MSRVGAYLSVARPAQWIKNGFVLVGLFYGHGWNDAALVRSVLLCLAGFCLISSAVYVFNDIMDLDADRAHPAKRLRPLASGQLGVNEALIFAALLAITGLVLGLAVSTAALALFLAYIGLNVAYSLGLKHIVVLDVVIIAAGFMLRILAGTLGVGIEPSRWLLFCGFMLTLFLGFAKRRSELAALQAVTAETGSATGDNQPTHEIPSRRVLATYSIPLLDRMISACAACVVTAYVLYTRDADTIALHGTDELVATVPFVLYGMGRYLWMLYRHGSGADPAGDLLHDPQLLLALLGWLGLTGWLIA